MNPIHSLFAVPRELANRTFPPSPENKRMLVAAFALVVVLAATLPARSDPNGLVDLGTPAGEAGVVLTDWGPVEPFTHPGGWGGLATDPDSYDHLCRTVWGFDENTVAASLTFDLPIVSAMIRHLDGGSDDSFKVEVDGHLWGSYTAEPDAEFWTLSSFSGLPGTTMKITCTAPAGPYWNPYGQLGIDRIEVVAVPEPVPLLLLAVGGLLWVARRCRRSNFTN